MYLFCIPVQSVNSIITSGVMQDVSFSFDKNVTNFTSLLVQRNNIKDQKKKLLTHLNFTEI